MEVMHKQIVSVSSLLVLSANLLSLSGLIYAPTAIGDSASGPIAFQYIEDTDTGYFHSGDGEVGPVVNIDRDLITDVHVSKDIFAAGELPTRRQTNIVSDSERIVEVESENVFTRADEYDASFLIPVGPQSVAAISVTPGLYSERIVIKGTWAGARTGEKPYVIESWSHYEISNDGKLHVLSPEYFTRRVETYHVGVDRFGNQVVLTAGGGSEGDVPVNAVAASATEHIPKGTAIGTDSIQDAVSLTQEVERSADQSEIYED